MKLNLFTKLLTSLFVLGIVAGNCFSQTKLTVIKKDSMAVEKDTINLRGIIYNTDGKPAKNIEIGILEQHEIFPDNYKRIIKTDTAGRFEFKGAKPYDTVRVVDIRYVHLVFANNGSRFMVIYLPLPYVRDINSTDPIEITAPRKYAKKKLNFGIKTGDFIFDGGWDGPKIYPEFRGGTEKFAKIIRSNIVYPEKAIDNNIEGIVKAAFAIGKDGSISNINIINGLGYGCDEQVIEQIKKIGKWQPGILCGRAVVLEETVSVKFSLTDK